MTHRPPHVPLRLRNWAGNYAYSTTEIDHPETVAALQALVRRHPKLRVLGTRHSFNGIADSSERLISLDRFEPTIQIDPDRREVTLSANVTYGQLCPALHRAGFALPNMASLPHISVAGACMTATHGSGVGNANLAASVTGLEMVTADGEPVHLSRERDGDVLNAAVVSLGGLGVVVRLTLALVPAFEVRQDVYKHLAWAELDAHFDAILASAYSVSLFTHWQADAIHQVWLKTRIEGPTTLPDDLFGATPATRQLHPIPELSGEPCTPQLGAPGPWHERLPHFRHDATPSAGDELQSEYFVARQDGPAAIRAVRALGDAIAPHLLVSEIRTIAADSLWLSPCYGRDSVAIHFTWKPDWPAVRAVLPRIEAQLAPFEARPHWGKLFTMPPERLHTLYERFPDFRQMLKRYDPQGKFRNAFLDSLLSEN